MKNKHEYETIEITNMCAIVNEKTKQVVAQDRIKSWKGITFPGGHVEVGESFVLSTIREIKEETGLDISNLRLCGIKNWYEEDSKKRYMVLLYYTNSFTGTLKESTDEGRVYWQDIKTLKEQNFSYDFEYMIDIILHGKYSEFFYEKDKITGDWIKKLI